MPAPIVNSKQVEIQDHLSAIIEEHERSISILYSELKLRLTSHLKIVTIQQLREMGVRVDPDISLLRGSEDRIRRLVALKDKVKIVRGLYLARVRKHFEDTKKALPRELLDHKTDDLTDEEWSQLGINMPRYRTKYLKETTD